MRRLLGCVAFIVVAFNSSGAQAHYFNLDAGRPGRVEDAIATERYELEAQFAPFGSSV